tara:strand:+ start:1234 stop:1554 length:321 start_codon:yes stop_codon:yes gene_type:complete
MLNNQLIVLNTANATPGIGSFVPFIILLAIMYVLIIRPQKRREKERNEMLDKIKTGDKVLLTSGIIGYITNTKEDTIIIKISDNTKVEAVRASISKVLLDNDSLKD